MAIARRADGGDVPGGKREFAVVGPLDQRLDDVLADEQCHQGEPGEDGDAGDGPLGPAEGK